MSVVDDFWWAPCHQSGIKVRSNFKFAILRFYWNHRTLHNVKWLWENVHSFHHQIREPTGLSTNYVHPLEMLLVSVGPFIGAILFRPTLFVLYLYIFIRTGIDIAHHTGWEFPFSPLRILPFHTQTKFHDTHHYISGYCGNAKNLATTSTIWDRVFGTYSSNESLFHKKS